MKLKRLQDYRNEWIDLIASGSDIETQEKTLIDLLEEAKANYKLYYGLPIGLNGSMKVKDQIVKYEPLGGEGIYMVTWQRDNKDILKQPIALSQPELELMIAVFFSPCLKIKDITSNQEIFEILFSEIKDKPFNKESSNGVGYYQIKLDDMPRYYLNYLKRFGTLNLQDCISIYSDKKKITSLEFPLKGKADPYVLFNQV